MRIVSDANDNYITYENVDKIIESNEGLQLSGSYIEITVDGSIIAKTPHVLIDKDIVTGISAC